MKLVFVGIGLCMLSLASVLAGIGHYDGVLGADEPEEILARDGPATFRVRVTGSPQDADASFLMFREELVLPEQMRDAIDNRQFVPVVIEGSEPAFEGYLEVLEFVPATGQTLVVSGTVRTEWALFDAGQQALSSMPVVFIHPDDYHEPLIFKR